MTSYRILRRLTDGSSYRLGVAVESKDGWRFISNVTSHKGSRKFHATMKKCLPRWVGYPGRCEIVAVVGNGEVYTARTDPPKEPS